MKCPRCQNDTFKVNIQWKHKDRANVFPVQLMCARCGHNLKAFITNEEMREVVKLLTELMLRVEKLETVKELERPEKRQRWRR